MSRAGHATGGEHAIEDYAAVGDCHGVALVARDGRVDWCALTAIDEVPVCLRLLDERRGGYLDTRPTQPFDAQRHYLSDSNVLRTELSTADGTLACTDFMPMGRHPQAAPQDTVHIVASHWLVRIVEAVRGEVEFALTFEPSVDWARHPAELRGHPHGVAWQGGALLCERPLQVRDGAAGGMFRLREGERMALILAPRLPPDPARALASASRLCAITRAWWEAWSARSCYTGRYPGAVKRSALALKLLAYAPTGAIAAAATTSLPEIVGGAYNWDYRLCWIRDATLTLFALATLGYHDEAERFSEFLFHQAAGDIFPTQILYGLHGEREPAERELPWLRGWRGNPPVRIGNAAFQQRQFDVYGEMMDWMLLRHALGATLDHAQAALLRRTADFVARHWRDPGHSFWEIRGAPRHYVYGMLMCWVALDRAQSLLRTRDYEPVMSAIVDEIERRGVSAHGCLRQRFGSDDADAVVLRAAMVDLPLTSRCLEATIDEVVRQLDTPRGLHRYRGLRGQEGLFVACGFWLVNALLVAGREDEARERFERMLAQANDVGLFAEEIDPGSGAFLGNMPQALSHLGLIHSATLLEIAERKGSGTLRGTHAHRLRHALEVMDAGQRQPSRGRGPGREAVLNLAELGLD